MRLRVLVMGIVLAASVRPVRAEPSDERTIGLLPVSSRWVGNDERTQITDEIIDVAREQGLVIHRLESEAGACWGKTDCYLAAAQASGERFVLAVELTKTTSRRLHLSFYLIDTAGTVRNVGRLA